MILKTSPFSIQEKKTIDIDNVSKKYLTLDESTKEQNVANENENTVHRRRDLDSIG